MKLFNKEKRLQYIGFNDIWFVIIGMIFLGFVTDYLFNNSFARYPFWEALAHWSISFSFSVINWSVMRSYFIFLRKKLPNVEQVGKRALILFFAIVVSVTTIDATRPIIIGYILDVNYYCLIQDRYGNIYLRIKHQN